MAEASGINVSVTDLEEFKLLEEVNQAVSDLILGTNNPDFANDNFGVVGLFASLIVAHNKYEKKFNTIEAATA